MRRLTFALAFAALLATPLAAQQPLKALLAGTPHHFGWVLEGSIEMGGDELFTVVFTDGEEQTIRAGQGGTFAFGAELRPRQMPNLGLRGTIGYKFVTTAAENANITFTRIPVEVVASYYLQNDWRLGAGLAYHLSPKLNGDGLLPDVSFDPAAGATLELGWKALALTYTVMDYSIDGASVGANAIGLSASWVFGKRF